MPNLARRTVALAVLAVAVIAAAVALDLPSVSAQSDEQTGRIVARRLDDGRTEFGWQPAGGERVLPHLRYFPANVEHHRWLNSSPIEVNGEEIGRINARLTDDGRIEFAFTPTGGERILPPSRYFPAGVRVGRWLRSTEITIGAAPAKGFVAISAGGFHTCAIRAGSGEIECWGSNSAWVWNEELEQHEEVYNGQLDAPLGRFIAVSAGYHHTCGLRENGRIECWAENSSGQAVPPAGSDFIAVSAGGSHTCGLRESGVIECWGWNQHGQADAPAGSFTAVSAGVWHTCGLRGSGVIECWGQNENGQADAPAGGFITVSAGGVHTCAIRGSGVIECWGQNEYYEGLSDAAGGFRAVSAGDFNTCALRESGAIECWGATIQGQTDASEGSFSAVSTGMEHLCGLREDGAIKCWGDNDHGQTDAPAP